MNDKNSGILAKISIEARTEVIKELFTDVAVLFDKSEEKVAKLVEVLQQQKDAVGHGNWLKYIRENFGGDPAIRRIQYFMRKPASSNNPLLDYLESEPATVPRSERKPADVVVSIPEIPDNSESETEADDDPTPDPPTQRKTAKGTEKIPEDKKPRTQTVPVEIVDDEPEEKPDPVDEWFQCHTLEDIVTRLIQKTENAYDQKKTAKALRKWADKLDPPTKFVKPDLEEVSEYFRELKSVDPESFFDFYESKGWLVGKVSMKDWRASARKWVRENSNGSNANGKSANNGRRGFTAEEVFG